MAPPPPRPLSEYPIPSATAPTSYQRTIYASLRKPLFSTKFAEWESLARSKVPTANFNYVFGSAGQSLTHAANVAAFGRYRLKPRMLQQTTVRDLSVELFGTVHASPLLVGPVGVQSIMHEDAEDATARACRNLQIPMVLSTAATRTIEDVAAQNGDGHRWFQLYWPKPQEEAITASLLKRAAENGFKVLVVTLDTFTLGWRPADLDEGYLPFLWGEGCQIGLSDPVFTKRYEEMSKEDEKPLGEALGELWTTLRGAGSWSTRARLLRNIGTVRRSRAWLDVMNSSTHRQWEDLEVLKKLWNGPIVLKGIQTVEDAKRAIEYGMDGIIVSNHGGRQLDGAIASLDALAEIAANPEVRKSGLTLLFDSGIRTGSDVLKALALGAKAVLIGRPYMYGLAIGGQQGIEHVLNCLLAETDNAMANAGKISIRDLSRDDLQMREVAKL